MEPTLHWAWWAVLSAVFTAIAAILLKLGLEEIEPATAAIVPPAVVSVVIAGYVCATGSWTELSQLNRKTFFLLLLAGLSTGASWLFYVRALNVGEVSKVVSVDRLSFVMVAVLAVLFLGERPSGRDWLGMGMVALGAVMLSLKR